MNEILIYGDIGFEVIPSDIVAQLREIDGPVDVRVDSYGGDVYAGISILNALRRHPGEVTVYVDGMAASAASYIAVGGADRLIMSPNSSMLVHGAWTSVSGNSIEFAETAANLAEITDNIASIYAEKSGKPKDYWLEVMVKDTTYSAEQAVEVGLADAVLESKKSAFAEQRQAVMASKKSRFQGQGWGAGVPEIESRASAPPPKLVGGRSVSAPEFTNKPSDGQEGENAMSFLNKLAQATGMTPEAVQAELSGIFNEQTAEVPAVITVSYPDEATVVPTGRTTVEPTSEVPEGLTFSVTGTTEGWTAEVNETTGVVTVVSADGSRIGDTGEVTLTVTGSGGDAEFTLKVTVVSADDKVGESTEGAPAADPAPLVEPGSDNVVVPIAFYKELTQAYAVNGERMAELAKRDREAEVDGWIAKGKFSAGLRAKALAALEQDPAMARRVWGGLPDGTIPRGEKGYTKAEVQDAGEPATKEEKIAAAMARANKLAQGQ